MKTLYSFVIILMLAGLSSCNKDSNTPIPETMDAMIVPDGFNYETDRTVTIKVAAFDNANQPIDKVKFDIYAVNHNENLFLLSLITEADGLAEISRTIPSYFDSILINTGFIGLPSDVKIKIENNTADYSKTIAFKLKVKSVAATDPVQIKVGNTIIRTLTGFNTNGVPTNLVTPNDIVDVSFLNDVNASLPEYRPVPQYHPEYLANSNETNLILSQNADVWVTFVHEGAGYKNILGFYKYNLGSPPTNKSSIDTIFVIFPNTSFLNSGGGLSSGNKVKIGTFKANTGIGWVLISDGYRNSTISAGNYILYSDPEFNPEADITKKQHNVLLFDAVRSKVLMGFEDVRRDQGSDQDFNDAIFYVTSNPITAIENQNYPKVTTTATDSDKDGIPDNMDNYPNDANKAIDNFFPSANSFATLAFEDLWPSKGDYDMNDLIIDYQFNQITDAYNKVVEISGMLILKAAGASYHNGFGFSLPISPSKVKSATGHRLKNNLISLDNNGMESSTTTATFIVFNDNFDILPYSGTLGSGVNTNPDAPFVLPDTIRINIVLNAPENTITLGNPPYNPFIFVNQDRTKEVHLPGQSPTSKANASLFGTSDDRTTIGGNKLYKTSNNLPWSLHISEGFNYPKEKIAIINAYTHFAEWAQSGGVKYPDWYKNLTGYRQSSNIYSKP